LNQAAERLLALIHLLVELAVHSKWLGELDRADGRVAGRIASDHFRRNRRRRTID
jgi:hypothetical protein